MLHRNIQELACVGKAAEASAIATPSHVIGKTKMAIRQPGRAAATGTCGDRQPEIGCMPHTCRRTAEALRPGHGGPVDFDLLSTAAARRVLNRRLPRLEDVLRHSRHDHAANNAEPGRRQTDGSRLAPDGGLTDRRDAETRGARRLRIPLARSTAPRKGSCPSTALPAGRAHESSSHTPGCCVSSAVHSRQRLMPHPAAIAANTKRPGK